MAKSVKMAAPHKNAVISVATGKTLTINGSLEAGLYQIFDCVGTGSLAGLILNDKIFAEWFGASSSASASTNTASIGKVHNLNRIDIPNRILHYNINKTQYYI